MTCLESGGVELNQQESQQVQETVVQAARTIKSHYEIKPVHHKLLYQWQRWYSSFNQSYRLCLETVYHHKFSHCWTLSLSGQSVIYLTCFDLRCVSGLSHQVIHSQEIRAESQSQTRPAEALVLSEVRDLQAELQDTLKALQQQQQQDPANILDDDKVTFRFRPFVAFSFSL